MNEAVLAMNRKKAIHILTRMPCGVRKKSFIREKTLVFCIKMIVSTIEERSNWDDEGNPLLYFYTNGLIRSDTVQYRSITKKHR